MLANGTRRLAILVAAALALVAVAFALDAHVRMVPGTCGGLALGLLVAALVPLRQARRLVRQSERGAPPPPAAEAYRASARVDDDEMTANRAIHHAAIALLLLSLAGTLTVVAAAAR
jgi:hypothetical protein